MYFYQKKRALGKGKYEYNSYLYIKDAKSYFDEPREDNLEVVKGFRSQGVHNILCTTRKFVIIKL
jgi:hypothetical protein